MSKEIEELKKLIQLLNDALSRDKALREKYDVGEKFRFVRDRLNTMLGTLENKLPTMTQLRSAGKIAEEDEVPVYVYLYNAQGQNFRTWIGMVNPKLFYEYSINRPIYADKDGIESMLRAKANKTQHAYITVCVKRANVLKTDLKDLMGNTLLKVKEGSLSSDRMLGFTHNGQEYELNEGKELIKKNER